MYVCKKCVGVGQCGKERAQRGGGVQGKEGGEARTIDQDRTRKQGARCGWRAGWAGYGETGSGRRRVHAAGASRAGRGKGSWLRSESGVCARGREGGAVAGVAAWEGAKGWMIEARFARARRCRPRAPQRRRRRSGGRASVVIVHTAPPGRTRPEPARLERTKKKLREERKWRNGPGVSRCGTGEVRRWRGRSDTEFLAGGHGE